MGINDLQLSPEMIAVLYPEILVASCDPAPTGKPTGPGENHPLKIARYAFSGKNLRSICVLVSAPDDEFMQEEKLFFLQKILEACKCTLDDIALINTHRQTPDMEKLKNQFEPRSHFFMGGAAGNSRTSKSITGHGSRPLGKYYHSTRCPG